MRPAAASSPGALKAADVALYASKRAGRDRVTLASAVDDVSERQGAELRAGAQLRRAS